MSLLTKKKIVSDTPGHIKCVDPCGSLTNAYTDKCVHCNSPQELYACCALLDKNLSIL